MKRLLLLLALLIGIGTVGLPVCAQVKKAERALKKEQFDQALEYVDVALQKNPDDAKALELQGRVYMGKASTINDGTEYAALIGLMKEAFDHALSADPSMSSKIEQNARIVYFFAFQRGVEVYTQAQSNNDDNAFLDAARYFEATTVIAPDSTGPYVNWAFALINGGREADAIAPLAMAVEQGESDVDVYTYLARLYLSNDRAAEAVPLLEQANREFQDNDLQSLLLNAYALAGQMDRALTVYQKAVAEEPDNKIYRYNYGSLLLEMEQYDPAVEHLQEAVRLDATYTDAQYNLGAAYVNKAVALNNHINELDDDLRSKRSSLSQDEITAREDEINTLTDERRELFRLAIEPLEHARSLGEAEGRDVTEICKVLFQSYAQTGQTEKAEATQTCAYGN
ncbi:MAG: tetratricopeptide repeat protein [Rhodothermales bacterium]